MAKLPVIVERHLQAHPDQTVAIRRLHDLFDLTWAEHIRVENSSDSYYLLKPKQIATEFFGFEKEVLCVYSRHPRLEPRTLYHAREVAGRSKVRARAERLYLVVIAPADDLASQVATLSREFEQDWIVVGLAERDLHDTTNPWFVRDEFAKVLFARDLYDMQQAIVEEQYFFGRQSLVLELRDRFLRGENSGVFGLRKTGKTSTLFRLRSVLGLDSAGAVAYLDAQSPAIYGLRWFELLDHIKNVAAEAVGATLPHPLDKPFTAATALTRTAQALTFLINSPSNKGHRLMLVIDEIEHLIPSFSPAEHWNTDFLTLWKLLRAFQTGERRFGFVVAGVNAGVVEATKISSADNPLFSMIGVRYMPPFTVVETSAMVQTLGRRMGLVFEEQACRFLQHRYGGHPLLIRLACSWEHRQRVGRTDIERPLTISAAQLEESTEAREKSVVQYVRHMLDVLREWYPSEFELLTLVADGDTEGFKRFAEEIPELLVHLRAYGLVPPGDTHLAIPVVGDFLAGAVSAERRKNELAARIEARSVEARSGGVARAGVPDRALPTLDEMLREDEGGRVEFKSTARYNLETAKIDDDIVHSMLKTIAAFLNSDGGHLAIGVSPDMTTLDALKIDQFASRDLFQQWLAGKIRDRLGNEHVAAISVRFVPVEDKTVVILDCRRAAVPAFLLKNNRPLLYCRSLSTTQELAVDEVAGFLKMRFPG